jgi:hypothetical protein
MELCYRGIRYKTAHLTQLTQQRAINSPTILTYRGVQYKPNYQSHFIPQKDTAVEHQLTYRGLTYTIWSWQSASSNYAFHSISYLNSFKATEDHLSLLKGKSMSLKICLELGHGSFKDRSGAQGFEQGANGPNTTEYTEVVAMSDLCATTLRAKGLRG